MDGAGSEAELWTLAEAADRLRLSVKQVRRLIYAERRNPGTGLESVKVYPGCRNAPVRIAPEAVIEYKARLRAEAQRGTAA